MLYREKKIDQQKIKAAQLRKSGIYLLQDNPADYSFFFDTSRRRTCYIAPERFVDDSLPANTRPALAEAMDIFSLGFVC